MIRREVQLPDGSAGWILVSQIEHARISAQLAEHCVGRFSSPELAAVRDEVLAAILHHDDGWADWERAPEIDLKFGRPRSFMELRVSDAIDVWSMSIASAEDQGPLAAWMVAGHFARLLEKSEHAQHDAAAIEWLAHMGPAREETLSAWLARRLKIHTREAADEALQWLLSFDELSLWLCCNCPTAEETTPDVEQRRIGVGTPIEMELSASGGGGGVGDDPARGLAFATPWRFDVDLISIEAAGRIVPAHRYDGASALLAASKLHTLRWQLGPATSEN
jgi:hypothetical protein